VLGDVGRRGWSLVQGNAVIHPILVDTKENVLEEGGKGGFRSIMPTDKESSAEAFYECRKRATRKKCSGEEE